MYRDISALADRADIIRLSSFLFLSLDDVIMLSSFDVSPSESPDVETSSDGYARRFRGRVGRFFLDKQARIVLNLAAKWPNCRVLDVGGGHAQLASPMINAGYRVTIAGSRDVCRSRLDARLEPGSFDYVTCDLHHLPYPDGCFDMVLAFRLLPHIDDWKALIEEMCRVSRRAVIVDYPDLRSYNIFHKATFCWKKAIEGDTRPFRCFRRRQLNAEFSNAGFGSPRFRPQFFFPMALHRAFGHARFSMMCEKAAGALGLTSLWGSPVILRVENLQGME